MSRFALLALAASPAAAAPSSRLDAALATWQGRTLPSPGNVSFAWEGVQARLVVAGGSAVTLLASSRAPRACLFHALVDGKLALNFSIGATPEPTNFTIAAGLDSGAAHTVVVWYATDPIAVSWDKLPPWTHSFHAFFSDGALAAPARPARRLQIIGDSITAGNQIDPDSCADDHLGTYGARACQHYDAECQTLAISGKGLYTNCCDADATMTELYKLTVPSMPETVYDNAQFVPDAVVLALGTNDQGHNSGPAWVANFTQAYASFLKSLATAHGNPEIPIFCLVGPITHDYVSDTAGPRLSPADFAHQPSPLPRTPCAPRAVPLGGECDCNGGGAGRRRRQHDHARGSLRAPAVGQPRDDVRAAAARDSKGAGLGMRAKRCIRNEIFPGHAHAGPCPPHLQCGCQCQCQSAILYAVVSPHSGCVAIVELQV